MIREHIKTGLPSVGFQQGWQARCHFNQPATLILQQYLSGQIRIVRDRLTRQPLKRYRPSGMLTGRVEGNESAAAARRSSRRGIDEPVPQLVRAVPRLTPENVLEARRLLKRLGRKTTGSLNQIPNMSRQGTKRGGYEGRSTDQPGALCRSEM